MSVDLTTIPPEQSLPELGLAERASGITGSVIDSSTTLLQAKRHPIVRFAMGSPAAEAIPTPEFADIARDLFTPHAFDYGPTEGERGLREALLGLLDEQAGAAPPLERLLITAGGMQGLDLVCKLLIDPGDLVVVESPTYTNGTATITGYGGRVLEAPVDDYGLVVEALPDLVATEGRMPRMLYVIPNFQNPSGTTLSLARRERLVELAAQWGAVILEDDPYELLRFSGDRLPSIEELAEGRARVVGVRTFSKFLAPGLRVGWITAAPRLIARMVDAKQSMDTCTNVPMQLLVQEFIRRGLVASHLEHLRVLYRERKACMQASLGEHLGDLGARWTDPDGGLFLWLTLPEEVSTEDLFPVALEEGVAFIPGPAFSVGGRFGNALRLCFASNAEDQIERGVEFLRRAVDRLLDQPSDPETVR